MEATYAKPGDLIVWLPGPDGEAERVGGRFIDEGVEAQMEALFAARGSLKLRLATGQDLDTFGHTASSDTVVVLAGGENDVEGHALALRFPTAKDAQEFQRRLLVTGVIAGALVVGVVGVNQSQTTGTGAAVGGATTISQPRAVNDDVGLMDASGAAISGAAQVAQPRAADDDVGLMDASGAAISGGQSTSRPSDDDVGLMDASGAAVSGQATSRAADDDVGLMDPSRAGAQDEPDGTQQTGRQFRGR